MTSTGRARAVFAVALAVAGGATIQPIWVGPIPPLQDFGGQAILVDAWVHRGEVPLYRETYEPTDNVTNKLPALFADLCDPALDTIAALRVFATLCLVATILGVLALLRAFERPLWQVFLALPFLWGSTTTLGLLSFMGILPLMLFAAAVARRAGLEGRWPHGVALLAVSLAAVPMHGLGYPFVLAAAAVTLALSLRRARHAWWLVALAPSLIWWWSWFAGGLGAAMFPARTGAALLARSYWFSAAELAHWFVKDSLNVIRGPADTVHEGVLAAIWLALLAVSGPPERPRATYPWIRDHALLLLVLVLVAGYCLLPAGIDGTTINQRLVTPLVFAACSLPRPRAGSRVAVVAFAVAVLTSLSFALLMHRSASAFARREAAPMERLAARIPPGSRTTCIAVSEGVMHRWSLLWNCPGLVALRTRGYTGGSFAQTPYNAVRFRPGRDLEPLAPSTWPITSRIVAWDYVLVRLDARAPPPWTARLVARAGPWRLYRVLHDPPAPLAVHALHGGSGGTASHADCPPRHVVTGLHVVTKAPGDEDDMVVSVTPRCRALGRLTTTAEPEGEPVAASTIGPPGRGRTLDCPRTQVAVGIHGRTGRFVDRIGLECAQLGPPGGPVTRTASRGGPGGTGMKDLCGRESVLVGLSGRDGALLDAIGIRCAAVADVLRARR